VVWAVELERAGSLEQMMPQVRESMMAGTVDALLRGAAGRGSAADPAASGTVPASVSGAASGTASATVSGPWSGAAPMAALGPAAGPGDVARARRAEDAAAEMQRWRSDAVLDDPIP
jgi:hypothetical protein